MATALTELLGTSALGFVTRRIHRAIEKSFVTHPMRDKTHAEIKRRFEICTKWFKVFRMDQKLSVERSSDEMARALRSELDGVDHVPHTRRMWTPDDDPDAELGGLVDPRGRPLARVG